MGYFAKKISLVFPNLNVKFVNDNTYVQNYMPYFSNTI